MSEVHRDVGVQDRVETESQAIKPSVKDALHLSPELTAVFKQALRQLAGGVALVSTVHEGVRHGLTVTAVSSLTMDPPALLVSVNRHAFVSCCLATQTVGIGRDAVCYRV